MLKQLPALLFLVPFAGAFLLPFLARLHAPLVLRASAFFLAVSAFFSFQAFCATFNGESLTYAFGGWFAPHGITWKIDALSALMTLLVSAVSCGVLASSRSALEKETGVKNQVPYLMACLLTVAGILGMLATRDLFNLFVFLEISGIATYALIASGPVRRAPYASFRYLLMGSLGATIYLLGVGYLYAATGTLNMDDMIARLTLVPGLKTVSTGVLLVFLGLAIKMGLFPFHGWLPDAYTHASNTTTSLIAPLATKAALFALIRIFYDVFKPAGFDLSLFFLLLKILGFAAIIAGSIQAFLQTDLKRLLAYSSVSHIGLIAVAVGLNEKTALFGAVLHIVYHALMKAGLFLFVSGLETRHGVRTISELSRFAPRMRFSFAFLALLALSMVGIPPLSGFFSKWFIVLGAFRAGDLFSAAGVIIAGLFSALYFFKVVEQAFFQKRGENPPREEAPGLLLASTGFFTLLVCAAGLFSPWLYHWASATWLKEMF